MLDKVLGNASEVDLEQLEKDGFGFRFPVLHMLCE